MKKILLLVLGLGLAYGIYNMAIDSPDSSLPIVDNQIHLTVNEVAENTTKPTQATVYIDASGSMKGYFISDNPKFCNTLDGIMGYTEQEKVYFDGSPKEYTGFASQIVRTLQGQPNLVASRFDQIFSKMGKEAKNGKICYLVTDGIMSTGHSTTFNMQGLVNMIVDSLKKLNATKAMAIYKYSSEFKSLNRYKYYDCNDAPHAVTIANRPFYVIAMGDKAAIRQLRLDEKELNPEMSLYFGIHDYDGHNKIQQQENVSQHLSDPNMPVMMTVTLPACLESYCEQYIPQQVELYNYAQKLDISKFQINMEDKRNLKLTIDPSGMQSSSDGIVSYTLKVKNANPVDAWKKISSQDDTQICKDKLQQGKTYGLDKLLEGMAKGFNEPEYLQIINFKFSN